MDLLLKEINATYDIDTHLGVKEERQNECIDNSSIEPVESAMAAKRNSKRFKNEVQHEAEVIKTLSKKRRKVRKANHPYKEKVHKKERKSDRTELPCIINIKSPDVLGNGTLRNHNGTCDTLDEMLNTSTESSISDKTCMAKIFQMLLDIQRTLKDLKAEMGETTKKIDHLQKFLPQPWAWKKVKSEFNFPVSTYEQLLELEKQLEDTEMANKLFVDLTSRTYNSWREMVLVSVKYMLSRDVAMLYNLNGIKGSKKKFRDLNMCNILVGSVLQKYEETEVPEILKRISLILAGATDWQGLRNKVTEKKIA